jgi:hypothetical protein
VPCRMDMWQY